MTSTEARWLDDLPPEMADHVSILRRGLAEVEKDSRLRALHVLGSVARGTGDRHSDLDLGLIVSDTAWPQIVDDLPPLVRRLGEVVDDHYQGLPNAEAPELFRVWAQYANGIQLDVMVLPSSRLMGSGGDGRTLHDPDGLFLRVDHPKRFADPDEISKWEFLCWGALTETAKYLGRGRPLAAAEWLNPGRQATISCWGALNGLEYAGFANAVAGQLGVTCPWPEGIERTYAVPEHEAVLTAAIELANLQTRIEKALDQRLGITRRPLGPWVRSQLELLQSTPRPRDTQSGRDSRPDTKTGGPRQPPRRRAGRSTP
jgi:predicted nucleotidyltransferase